MSAGHFAFHSRKRELTHDNSFDNVDSRSQRTIPKTSYDKIKSEESIIVERLTGTNINDSSIMLTDAQSLKIHIGINSELGEPIHGFPKDQTTSLHYNTGDETKLIATSLDKSLYIYNAFHRNLLIRHRTSTPLLSACTLKGNIYTGGADNKIRTHDLHCNTFQEFGAHSNKVSCIASSDFGGRLISGSWDKCIKIWDANKEDPCIASLDTKSNIYAMDIKGHLIAIGTSGERIKMYDSRNLKMGALMNFVANVTTPIKSIKISEDKKCIYVGSSNGIMSKEHLKNHSMHVKVKYEAHTFEHANSTYGFPVNCIENISGTNYFATGGSDGVVNIWEHGYSVPEAKLPQFPTSISALAYSKKNEQLAIASSYVWDNLEMKHPIDQIYVRDMRVDAKSYKLKNIF
ncbi:WD40 repeat-like protein [Neoconidiobolus thromboides FSU 785]|nr:WD40 repeat-like protein [Neoconidiobolus thromboides FSU 785]